MSIFGHMKPSRIVKKAMDGLAGFRETTFAEDKAQYLEIISKNFGRMTDILYKKIDGEEASSKSLQLINEIAATNFILDGILILSNLPVEHRRQFTMIFTGAVAYKNNGESPLVKYIEQDPDIIDTIIHLYNNPELAITAGEMLRVCATYESLTKQILSKSSVNQLFKFFTVPLFDVAADSFSLFREILLSSPIAKQYIRDNYDFIVEKLNQFSEKSHYASSLQSLRLIRELIETNEVFNMLYLSSDRNFDLILQHFTSQYKNIAIEALKIFKLFIDFKKSSEKIRKFTKDNKDNLIKYADALLDFPLDQSFRTNLIDTIQNQQ
ncbi:hypothetical protein TVAG_064500 [Trichomonas vaginalis G3]|uniref:Uncharacterized protein n=1 Tax=Trichomonas vaginalis (strain ATCC PRA-98 / G3) TaxID=412133 RepID=A2EHC5_TRIV3|nr:positive regulation of peptidyl-threonine phosphorylation [Trichomonas vaginalis G3]EAY07903.1 hypothetical protein TVAG_064500 [Trichomonas vaginalis G3]KAI5531215.1 positive regulation of peptidyl-threonine phosphorylation [Trichomonas vaginalis G3]|eukprot:XP_001320126.1 hypothetical protein [Trichomonas vaginalis G3]